MGTRYLKPGTTVRINFPEVHRELYPHYCERWQGRCGIVVESSFPVQSRGYASIYVGGQVLCIERAHMERIAN
jgi:hypothetical protein